MSYSCATKKEIIKQDNSTNQYKSGWTYYSKKTKKCIYKSNIIKLDVKQELTCYDIIEIYKNLSHHWNNYRDEINDLLGDISPYYNYKLQLKNIELEEKMIEDSINNRVNNNEIIDNVEYF